MRSRAALAVVVALLIAAFAALVGCAQEDPPPPAPQQAQQVEQEAPQPVEQDTNPPQPAEAPPQEQQAEPQPEQPQPEPSPSDGLPFAADAALLARLRIASESDGDVDYDRDTYLPGGWGDADGDGCNTREEVLIAEAREITSVNQWCRPIDGSWWSWYDEIEFDDPGDIDIDHMVPLFEAHHSGGWQWSEFRRVEFANDLNEPAALTAVSSRSNREKSADDPAQWRPPARSAWCQYARDWITVKVRWALTADQAEIAALRMMLETCEAPPESRPAEQLDRPVRRVEVIQQDNDQPTPQPTGERKAVYDSCDEAEAAGEPRIQGEQGAGQGFPAEKVPSARDGDQDGIVCER